MELSEFVTKVKKEVEAFYRDYLKRNYTEPDAYPLNIDEGEWWEWLSVFDSTDNNKETRLDCDTCKNDKKTCKHKNGKDKKDCPGYIIRK